MGSEMCIRDRYKSTMGLFKFGQYILLITAGLNLVGDIVLGQYYGVFGIFLATAIARLVTNTWYDPFVIFKHGFHKKFKSYLVRYGLYLLVLITTCLVCYEICGLLQLSVFPRLLLKTIICISIPNLIFCIVFYRFTEFEYLLRLAVRIKDKIIQKLISQSHDL